MKAILISDKPKWCALMMNGEKTVEVRTSKALYKAIQKLIDENGYADIYVYCSKGKPFIYPIVPFNKEVELSNFDYGNDYEKLNGKVAFKFRCYKAEEVESRKFSVYQFPYTKSLDCDDLLTKSYLTTKELDNYLGYDKTGYAIHISDLEIFDKPKELSEFKQPRDSYGKVNWNTNEYYYMNLTKAPQNFCYVEVE